jgi:hypothetical protein
LGPLTAKIELGKDQQSPPCPTSGCRHPQRPKFQASLETYERVVATDLFSQVEQTERPDLRDLRLLLESIYQRGEFQLLEKFVMLVDRSPGILPYFATFLVQESSGIPSATRKRISKILWARLRGDKPMMDYEVICIARILSTESYRDSREVAELLDADRFQNLSPALMQFVLPTLDSKIDDNAMTFLEARFDAAAASERRAIARLLLPAMGQDRRSAFADRQRARIDSDLFLQSMLANHGRESVAVAS